MIKIGIPSKGRLRKDTLSIFKNKNLKILSERGERDLFGYIKGNKKIKIVYLHAREIIERLGDGSLDIGFSGFDLLKESEITIQNKISVSKKYNFGKAKVTMYATDSLNQIDANGSNIEFNIGGTSKNFSLDKTPPDINIFLNTLSRHIT